MLVIGVNDIHIKEGIVPLQGSAIFLFDSPTQECNEWHDWHFWGHKVEHRDVGGVSSASCRYTVAIHNASRTSFDLNTFSIPQHPASHVAAIVDCTISGQLLHTPPRLAKLAVLEPVQLSKRLYHPRGLLLPWKHFDVQFPLKCVFSASKFVTRPLSQTELYHVCDIPVSISQCFGGSDGSRVLAVINAPLKCYNAFIASLFLNAKISLNGGDLIVKLPTQNLTLHQQWNL